MKIDIRLQTIEGRKGRITIVEQEMTGEESIEWVFIFLKII